MTVADYTPGNDAVRLLRELYGMIKPFVTGQRRLQIAWRDRLLKQVDEIERVYNITPRTADMRRYWKEQHK